MKSVTEFLSFKLEDGLKAKAALAAEGKAPDEITTAMGEQFKMEGDKLKCFVNAVELAGQSSEKLFKIKVVKLNEGQNPPPRGTVIEDLCYITEPKADPTAAKKADEKEGARGNSRDGGSGAGRGGKGGGRDARGGGRGGKGGKPKESPWGISPEEKEAKAAVAREAARAKSLAGKS